MPKLLVTNEKYSIRTVSKDSEYDQELVDLTVATIAGVYQRMEIGGHLFITLVGTHGFSFEGDDTSLPPPLGLYQDGIRHIGLAVGGYDDSFEKISKEEWARQVQITAIHEIIHYVQDIEGRLGVDEKCEDEAENLAMELLEFINAPSGN